jgi:hypothetical protein
VRWFRNNVDSTLTDFFALRRRGCAGARLERIRRVEEALRDCVECLAEDVLTTPELTLLAAEQQLRPLGAAARVAAPDALLEVLPAFLRQEQWRSADLDERRAQVLTAAALTRHLVATLTGDLGCALIEIEAAIAEAAGDIRSAKGRSVGENPRRRA